MSSDFKSSNFNKSTNHCETGQAIQGPGRSLQHVIENHLGFLMIPQINGRNVAIKTIFDLKRSKSSKKEGSNSFVFQNSIQIVE
jgi:hypothetical protein